MADDADSPRVEIESGESSVKAAVVLDGLTKAMQVTEDSKAAKTAVVSKLKGYPEEFLEQLQEMMVDLTSVAKDAKEAEEEACGVEPPRRRKKVSNDDAATSMIVRLEHEARYISDVDVYKVEPALMYVTKLDKKDLKKKGEDHHIMASLVRWQRLLEALTFKYVFSTYTWVLR